MVSLVLNTYTVESYFLVVDLETVDGCWHALYLCILIVRIYVCNVK